MRMHSAVAAMLLVAEGAMAQSSTWNDAIDAYAAEQLAKWDIPAASIAVVREGEIVHARGYGLRDPELGLSADENTLYAIGSITKSFTAAAIGLLVERDHLSWDSRIVDLLDDFRLVDDFATERITPVDLLCHRSGLPDHNFVWYFSDFSREDLVYRLRFLPPSADLRTEFQYCPLMYNLAGYVVEKVAGSTWEEFTTANLFRPLGMSRSNFSNEEYLADDNHAAGFATREGKLVAVDLHPSQTLSGPAGSINSSVVELAQWMIANLSDGLFDGAPVLAPETVHRMQSPHMPLPASHPPGEGPEGAVYSFVSYGLGWMIGTYYDQIVVEHSGAIDGFSSKMSLLPRLDSGLVILTNHQTNGEAFIYSMESFLLAGLMDREPFDASAWLSAQGLPESIGAPARPVPVKLEQPAEDFAGVFTDPGYGDIVVTGAPDGLRLRYYRFDVELVYQGANTFRTHGGIISRNVKFVESENGLIDRLEIQWARAVDPIVFLRR